AALALRPAADHELLEAARLDLQPVARALALAVRRGRTLGHDALEALLGRDLAQRLAVGERARDLNGALPLVEEGREPLAPLRQRQLDDRLAVELEQVEGLVHERRVGLPLLHRREARPPVLVEGAHLAV